MKPNKQIAQILFLFKGAKVVFVLFLLIIIFLGCIPYNINTPVNSNLKSAFYFRPGTYWIYKDAISGRVDSFYVRKIDSAYNVTISGYISGDYLNVSISDRIVGNSSSPDTFIYEAFQLSDSTFSLQAEYNNSTNSLGTGALFSYPFKLGGFPSGDQAYCSNIYPSYTLNGQSFSNVAEISHNSQSSLPGSPYYYDTYEINSDIGIIKMNLNHPYDSLKTKVWELQRWHIVK